MATKTNINQGTVQSITVLVIVLAVLIAIYMVYKKVVAPPGSTEAKQAAIDQISLSSATLSPGQAQTIADSIYDDLNAYWITSSGYVDDIQKLLNQCQNSDDWNLVVKQFGTRASTVTLIPGFTSGITDKMTLPEFMKYKMSNSDYIRLTAPFNNSGLI